MKKQFGEYYLGLDIGTDSVGWAATTPDYEILKFHGKDMWGIHLFESGQTAENRRLARTARRRTERRAQRAMLLRDLFRAQIDAVDNAFYERLADSKFFPDDKAFYQKNTLFNEANWSDKDYHKAYPTIYHLRSELLHSTQPHDVRLVYLAIHHILKHRGHFLFEGENFEAVTSFTVVFEELLAALNDAGIPFEFLSADTVACVEQVMKNRQLGISQKKKQLTELFLIQATSFEKEEVAVFEAQKKQIVALLSGGKVSLDVLFHDESLKDAEVSSISFKDGVEDKWDALSDILDDKMFLLSKLKALYDWSVLINILQGEFYLSDAKIAIYEQHKQDLKMLKRMITKYLSANEKKAILGKGSKTEKNVVNYAAYVQHKTNEAEKLCTQKDFCTALKKKFESVVFETAEENEFYQMLEDGRAFPKQVSKENGVIPYQLHLQELTKILQNAEVYLPFLKEKDEDGITVSDKIISLLTFRIPYYVGPLNPYCKDHAWVVKNKEFEGKKIYPWNFDAMIDKEASRNQFIRRMTNPCTYLPTEDVLAKQSILYSKYNILNQLNNLRVNGDRLPVAVKQKLFEDLYLNVKRPAKVTFKKLRDYFKTQGLFGVNEDVSLSGVDQEIVGDMKSYLDFKRILGDEIVSEEIVDEIIQEIVILGESKTLVKQHLKNKYEGLLTAQQISAIAKLNYTGWGSFSRAFLTHLYQVDYETGEILGENIINAMYTTQSNLMELLSNQYQYLESIECYNRMHGTKHTGFCPEMLDELYLSPAVKRGVWRVLMIAKEIEKVAGHAPEKIFVEVARDIANNGKKGKRTVSRKQHLLELYKKCQEETPLLALLQQEDEGKLRSEALYLYYTQMGRCMYSGEAIDLSQIKSAYDVDHIYPQSKVKDDSIAANKVLVKKELNHKKSDKYPIPSDCLKPGVFALWNTLYKTGLITKEKYERLTRKTEFSSNELSGFIARQLVETRQSTKAVAHLFAELYPKTDVVYVKAQNVSMFRHDYNIPKSRIVNDYHHAVDAYLNVVVGNVYDEKFTVNYKRKNDALAFVQSGQVYSMNRVFEYPVVKGTRVVWQSKDNQSLCAVKHQLAKKKPLFTRYATINRGEFYKALPLKAGKGQQPLKTSDPRFAKIERYGAYNSVSSAYYFLVEHTLKKKRVRTIEFLPVLMLNKIKTKEQLAEYVTQELELKDARILVPCIKINTLFKVDGFAMHLSGRTGNRLSMKAAVQLMIAPSLYAYAKKIEKYVERNKEQKTIFPITSHQKITAEENLFLYDELLHKLRDTIYAKCLSAQVVTFEKGRERFKSLSLPQQCQLIYNAVGLFNTVAGTTDLSLLGGTANAGKLLIGSNITTQKDIKIVYQSVTGLFEKVVDLKKL